MPQKGFRVVYTGGGSGGPTIPLLAVHDHLMQQLGKDELQAEFWGSAQGPEKDLVDQAKIPFSAIPSGKLRRYWSLKNFVDPIFIALGFIVGLIKLLSFKPDVVVSAGSFVSVPVAYAAKLLKIPHIIFQMDVHPGLANRLMAPASDALAYLFEDTVKHFPKIAKHQIGPVVRREIEQASAESANRRFDLNADKPVLLVTGGGQGAVGLNQAITTVLDYWLEHFQVVHLTGPQHEKADCDHPDYHAMAFITEGMGDLLARSDLVVTRAGLGIMGELACLGKDTVFVPMPRSHQELNCAAVVNKNGAYALPQDEFLNKGLAWWQNFMSDYTPHQKGKVLQQLLPPGGTEAFGNLILQYRSGGKHPST